MYVKFDFLYTNISGVIAINVTNIDVKEQSSKV